MIRIYSEDVEWIFNQDVRDKKRTGNGIHGRAARLRKHESVKMPSEREPDKFQRRLTLNAGPCFITTLREMKLLKLMEKVQTGEYPTVAELKEIPYEDGQKLYAELRRLHTTTEILKGLDCAPAQISELSWHFKVARKGKQILVGDDALDVLRDFRDNRLNQVQTKRENDDAAAADAAAAGTGSETQPTTSKRKYKKRVKKELPPGNENGLAKKEEAVDKKEEIAPNQLTLVEVKNPEIELLRISLKNIYSADQITSLFTRLQLFVEGQENNFELNLVLQERVPS